MLHYSMLQRRRQCGKGQRSEWASAECTMLRFRTLEQAELAKTIRWSYCLVAGKEARKIAVRPLSPAPISVAPAGTTAVGQAIARLASRPHESRKQKNRSSRWTGFGPGVGQRP